MIISFQRKFVFVALPKTAGHALRAALRPHLSETDWEQCTLFEKRYFPVEALAQIGHGHISCRQIKPFLLPTQWTEFLKFGFVRNPYDRFVSYYFFRNGSPQAPSTDISYLMKQVLKEEIALKHFLMRPQYEFVCDREGTIMLDYLGRYESLQACFDDLCGRLSLPTHQLERVNKSKHLDYREYLDEELQEMIYQRYQTDFELFDYSPDIEPLEASPVL